MPLSKVTLSDSAGDCGKYIFQADNDDLLMNNALEIFYKAAEASGAEVVHTAGYILFNDKNQKPFPYAKNLSARRSFVDKPSFLPNDTDARIKLFCNDYIGIGGLLNLVRRDLLVENDIFLQEDVKASQDIMWTIKLFYYAKSYLFIPSALYIIGGVLILYRILMARRRVNKISRQVACQERKVSLRILIGLRNVAQNSL